MKKIKHKQAEYRVYRCISPDCNQIIGYNSNRRKIDKVESLCFECLIKKKKSEMEKGKRNKNRFFDWNY